MFIETAVSEVERRQALEAVLNSRTFARTAQLRAFLQYICDRQVDGHPEELTEYQIAVNVLGRAKDYNLADDSAVRNRAYELRQRLEKFYGQEETNALVQIEIPKGSYVPSFIRRKNPTKVIEVAAPAPQPGPYPQTGPISPRLLIAAAAILGLLAGYALNQSSSPRVPAVLRGAWGPLGDPGGELLISIATNLHLIVRPHILPQRFRFPAPDSLREVYGPERPLDAETPLFMEPAQLSVPLAEMIATNTLCNMRVTFGGACQILPEAEAPVAALRGRNAVLIGSGTNSQTARILLRNLPWTVDYTPDGLIAILDQRKPAGHNTVFPAQPLGGFSGTQYGLLTVINSMGPGGKPKRLVVISGIGSASVQSAVEFWCSPQHMRELQDRFRAGGLKDFPWSYQLLVRCRTTGIRPLSYEYAAHVVIRKQADGAQ